MAEEIDSVCRDLKFISDKKAQAAILRARCKWMTLGEKPTNYIQAYLTNRVRRRGCTKRSKGYIIGIREVL